MKITINDVDEQLVKLADTIYSFKLKYLEEQEKNKDKIYTQEDVKAFLFTVVCKIQEYHQISDKNLPRYEVIEIILDELFNPIDTVDNEL